MKPFMKNLKIKHKLVIIIMSTVIFSLLLVSSVLILSERYISKQSMADKLMTVSHIIADRSTAALSFDDPQVANEVLSALDHEPSVLKGCIYDSAQLLFAAHARDGTAECPKQPQAYGYRFGNKSFELYQPIRLEGEVIGTVYISASLDQLNQRLLQFILLILSMVFITGIAAYFIARRQQAIISKPILDLANVARQISADGDYTTRLPQTSNDEIGTLNHAFNDMLEQIYQRQIARDLAEQALSEREQDLVVTLNSIGDAVIVTDVDGMVTRMNPVAEQLTGWTFKEAQQHSLKTIFPIVHASSREPIENPVEKVISSGETVFLSNHTTLIAKDGSERQIADSAAPIRNEQGNILGLILVFNDVTEQYLLREAAAKSERDLQAIMDNSPAIIYVKDSEGFFTFINHKFEKLFGMKRKYVIGKTLHDIFPKNIADEMQGNDKAVLMSGHALESEEIAPQEDGVHIYSSIKFPLFDEDNKVYAVCGISTDITERKQQEDKLRRSQKMDALGKLTGGIAHDYNNLLGIILGYAELLNGQLSDNPKLAKYAHDIEHAAERGSKLTRKLLAFSRRKTADASLLNINNLLREQQLMLEKTLTARITLTLDLAEDLWSTWLDSGDLEDAIINISINASHAIEGNGELTFRTCNEHLSAADALPLHLQAGDYVMLSITDTGSGMDETTKENIFDPFFSTKGDRGTGLGLSQVYGFVKRSGGEIKVYSEPGQGSRFALYFPRSHKADIETDHVIFLDNKSLQGNETILVVDDEPALVELAKEILSTQGYHVLTASDGEQALEVLKKENVDLVLSDVIMPNMDGYQLAEQIQKNYPHIKIQMASGFADGRHDHMINNNLHQNLLHKPYASNTLLAHVRSLLDNNKNQHSKFFRASTESKNTILIMDDEEGIRELFSLNLEMLGYDTILTGNSDQAIARYQQALQNGQTIAAVILDLNIPGSLSGKEVAAKIRALDARVKIIVSSGDTGSPEMNRYQDHGFDGALEKTFDREKIRLLLEGLSV